MPLPELTTEEIEIAAMQKAIKDMGWQWQEHIYNDGYYSDCMLDIAKRDSPGAFRQPKRGDVGWGRFSRRRCWVDAYQYVMTKNQQTP